MNDGGSQSFFVGLGVDFCFFFTVGEKSAFEKDGGDFNAGQHVKPGMFNASVCNFEVVPVFDIVEVSKGPTVNGRGESHAG